MEKSYLKKTLSVISSLTLIVSAFNPLQIFAAINSTGNSMAPGYVNSANSGSYDFSMAFSGTLDAGDIVAVDITDSTGSVISLSGSNSGSGGITFSGIDLSSLAEGDIIFSGSVYDSGQVAVASGITATAVKDTIAPTVSLASSTASGTSIQSGSVIAVTGTLSEPSPDFNSGSIAVSSGTISGFSGTGTTFEFNVTASGDSQPLTIQVLSGSFSDMAGNQNISVSNILSFGPETEGPVIAGTFVRNITQTGAQIDFNFTEQNFASGSGYVIVFTGGSQSNLIGTGSTSLSFAGGSGSGSSVITGLTGSTAYGYLVHLADDLGNIGESSGSFTTIGQPVGLTGDISVTGSVVLTGSSILVGGILDLSGVTVTLVSNSADSGYLSGSLMISGASIVVSGSTAWNGVLLPPTLINSAFSLAATGSEIGTGISVLETVMVGAEGASLAASGGYFNVSFRVPGSSSGNVVNLYRSGDGTNWTRVSPDGSCTLDSNLMCSFRTDHLSLFAVTTVTLPFSFANVTNAELNTAYTASVVVSGISSGSQISISGGGGQYQIGSGTFTSSTGTISNGDLLTVRLTSPNAFSSTASTTITIGGASTTFSVTTKASSGGGGGGSSGGGGGGGGGLSVDRCPGGDTSASYYDGLCAPGVPVTPGTGTGTTGTGTTGTGTTGTGLTFSDIEDSFAKDDILSFAARGILRGYPDGTFRPNNPITRAEFLGVTMKTLNISLDVNATVDFIDIPTNGPWMIPYIAKAGELGIAYGQIIDGEKRFRPNDPVTRAEAVTMLLKAAAISTTAGVTVNFVDIPPQTSWAIRYIKKAQELGIISGQISITRDPIFRPNDDITRAEAVRVISRTLAQSGL